MKYTIYITDAQTLEDIEGPYISTIILPDATPEDAETLVKIINRSGARYNVWMSLSEE